jgi:hypothetical protein
LQYFSGNAQLTNDDYVEDKYTRKIARYPADTRLQKKGKVTRSEYRVPPSSEVIYFYHATRWENAKQIELKGPSLNDGLGDLACGGAFYLGTSFKDCLDWLKKNEDKFRGKYAILVYQFNPKELNVNGRDILGKKKWKKFVLQMQSGPSPYPWVYTYQDKKPGEKKISIEDVQARRGSEVQPAMQLVIYTEKMCQAIHRCLVKCIYFSSHQTIGSKSVSGVIAQSP